MMRNVILPSFVDLRFGRMIGWALLAITFFMLFADPIAIFLRPYWPAWVPRVAHFLNCFGDGRFILLPVGILFLISLCLQRLRLGAIANGTLAALTLRLMLLFSAIAVPGIVSSIAKGLIGRLRPRLFHKFGDLAFDPFSWNYDALSFPSGHTTLAFATAFILSTLTPRFRVAFYGVACAVGAARVLLGAHYPSDVIAGAIFGTLFACLTVRAFALRGLSVYVTLDRTIRPKTMPRLGAFVTLAYAIFATLIRRVPRPVLAHSGRRI
jgi:membrane-associated phospholipid phosphatase